MTRRIVPLLAFLPLVLAAAGCEDDAAAPATTGQVAVETVTTGASLDADGFIVSIAGGPGQAIGLNASLKVFAVQPGARTVELTDLAQNCSVSGSNPREVEVTAGETTTVRIEVACEGVGSVEIRASAEGLSIDPDGFRVSVGGGAETALPVDGVVSLSFLEPGPLSVELTDIAPNCAAVPGENPREVVVSVDEVALVQFHLTCEGVGSLEVRAATGGVAYDIDGYAVSIEGAPWESVGYAGTVRRDYLSVGTAAVELSGVAPNCAVSGENLREVEVALDEVTTVQFDVMCSAVNLGWIVVLSDREGHDGLFDIVILDETGAEIGSPTTVRDVYGYPVLSPDGTRIAFVQWYFAGSDVFVMNVDGTGLVNLTKGGSGFGAPESTHPSWSPEGTRILFASDLAGDMDLYAIDADGSNLTPVLVEPGLQWEGSWSPDGSRILFNGSGEVWIANADGTGRTQMTAFLSPFGPSILTGPAWSPDGSRFAFYRFGFDAGVYVMDAVPGPPLVNVTGSDFADASAPSWSPDGTRLVFAARKEVADDWEVYVMNADGSGQTNLTNSPASEDLPGSPQGWR